MSIQCMQVAIVVFGSREPMFFDYDRDDGFRNIRYVNRIFNFISPNSIVIYYLRSFHVHLPRRHYHIRASFYWKANKCLENYILLEKGAEEAHSSYRNCES